MHMQGSVFPCDKINNKLCGLKLRITVEKRPYRPPAGEETASYNVEGMILLKENTTPEYEISNNQFKKQGMI